MKYTFSDEEDAASDAASNRRSNRHSGLSTPAEPSGPTFTASGRQVRSRHGGSYGESLPSTRIDVLDEQKNGGSDGVVDERTETAIHGRLPRNNQFSTIQSQVRSTKHHKGYESLDSVDNESDVTTSGGEWEGGDSDEPDEPLEEEEEDDDDEEEEDEDMEMNDSKDGKEEDLRQSLVVSLRYRRSNSILPEKSRGDWGSEKDLPIPFSRSSDPDQSQLHYTTHLPPDVSRAEEASGDRKISSQTTVGGSTSVDDSNQIMPQQQSA